MSLVAATSLQRDAASALFLNVRRCAVLHGGDEVNKQVEACSFVLL